MPYSQEIYQLAKERLSQRRQNALRLADVNREQLFKEIPRLREIDSELLPVGASIAKTVVKDGDMKALSERSLALQNEQEQILLAHHINKEIIKPQFTCTACQDTGYIESDNHTEVCDCLKKLMADIAGEQLSADLPLNRCTFDSFKLDYYSKEPDILGKIPYNRMSNILQYCIEYAEAFSVRSKSLLLKGATGLGKTHLSLAIANVVIRRGMSVIYVSAPEIFSKLEREHFSYRYDKQEDTFNSLIKCDLLILDDLGTEFISEFTRACAYNLFNSRLLAGKPIIISTNMMMEELVKAYSQRFVSRVMGSCDKLDFIGEDVRQKK